MASGSEPFAIATCDEAWAFVDGALQLVERRESWGVAESVDGRLVASDLPDAELVARTGELVARARARLLAEAGDAAVARLIVSARRAGIALRDEILFEVTVGGMVAVSTPEYLASDVAALRQLGHPLRGASPHALPAAIVWRRGTAAVLLHEAVGHAAECGARAVEWPGWLAVNDVPPFDVDDIGRETRASNLLAGEPPQTRRRETFRDVPLPRMTRVVVEGCAAFDLPHARLEVELVSGGSYDALRDEVRLAITCSSIVEGDSVQPLRPFVFSALRSEIAAAMRGAGGAAVRYPGVICSREAQDVYVEAIAPDVLTVFR